MGWMTRRVPAAPTHNFEAIDTDDIPASFFGLTSYTDTTAPASRVSRQSAIQVPAVKRARDLIAGTLGTLPLDLYGPDNTLSASALLTQPERNVPRSVTIAKTIEDMLFEGVAWWLIVEYGWHTYPTKVVRLDPRTVNVRIDGKVYYTRSGNSGVVWEYAPDADLIRFDSPNDALLLAGARAIRTCLSLDAAAERYSSGNQPLDYFTPSENTDPDEADLDAAMDAWDVARARRSTGYVPASLKYNTAGWNPEQLQMSEARDHAVLEIARVAGVDPEDLGVSTTSRTYQNSQDRRKSFIDFTVNSYAVAFEERISMPDVTPRGYRARINYAEFMRTDDVSRMGVASTGVTSGLFTPDEGRAYFDSTLPEISNEAVVPALEDSDA